MKGITLLIGATSGTGYQIARLLLQQGRLIRIVARNRQKAQKLFGNTTAEIVISDLTKPDAAFYEAFKDVENIYFTAGVPAGFARESEIIAIDFGGLEVAIEAAKKANFSGRFVYMTTTGLSHRTFAIRLLNFIKPNIIRWRLKAEQALVQSGLNFTVVRAGVLTNKPEGMLPVQIFKDDLPIYLSTKVSRQDVARVIIEAPQHPGLAQNSITVIWGSPGKNVSIHEQLANVH